MLPWMQEEDYPFDTMAIGASAPHPYPQFVFCFSINFPITPMKAPQD